MTGERAAHRKRVPPKHRTEVDVSAGYSGPGYWLATCRCGWAGPPRSLGRKADKDAERHMEEVTDA